MAQPLAVVLRDAVVLLLGRGDSEGDAVAEPTRVGEGVALAQLDGLPLPLGEREAAAQGEGRAERDAGAELLTERLGVGEGGADRDAEAHGVLVPVRDAQGEADRLLKGVLEARGDRDAKLGDAAAVAEAQAVALPEKEAEPDIEGVRGGDAEAQGEEEAVAQPENEGELQGEGDDEEVLDG